MCVILKQMKWFLYAFPAEYYCVGVLLKRDEFGQHDTSDVDAPSRVHHHAQSV